MEIITAPTGEGGPEQGLADSMKLRVDVANCSLPLAQPSWGCHLGAPAPCQASGFTEPPVIRLEGALGLSESKPYPHPASPQGGTCPQLHKDPWHHSHPGSWSQHLPHRTWGFGSQAVLWGSVSISVKWKSIYPLTW